MTIIHNLMPVTSTRKAYYPHIKPELIKLTIFFIFLLQGFIAQSQWTALEPAKLKVDYNLLWKEDSLNPFHIREERFVLLSGRLHSQFISYRAFLLDSLHRKNPNLTLQDFRQLNPPRAAHLFQIHKNFLNQQISTYDRVFMDGFTYTEPMAKINWKLTNEFGQIAGYSVQKATTNFGGRTWEAWFAKEIPQSDGPYKFSGLPGLIIKIQDTKGHYVFEVLSILPTNETIYLRNNSSAFKTTKAQFLEARRKFNRDGVGAILSSGTPVHQSFNQDVGRIEENLRRRNNPIELKAD